MAQKLVLATVLLVLVLTDNVFLTSCQQYESNNNSPDAPETPLDGSDSPKKVYVINTVAEEESNESTSTMIPSTTETSVDSTTQPIASTPSPVVGTVGQDNRSLFNSLFGRNINGPTLVVEVNDATNEASLKIMNLPLIRLGKTATTSATAPTTTGKIAETAKSRRKRDIDFKIYDQRVIHATIDALKRVHDVSVDILEANIDRLEIKVELKDNECWIHDRTRREVEFKIRDMSVVNALIDALRDIDPLGADYLEYNIDDLEISVEIEDDDHDDDDD